MKRGLIVLVIILLVFFVCTACTDRAQNSQTPVASSSAKPQATQQIPTPTHSPTISKEPQPTINKDNAITKSEVISFLNGDNEFAANMLQYPAKDMNNLDEIILMIAYPLGATFDHRISFDVFNRYTKKYINRAYADSDFTKYITDKEVAGVNANMEKREFYLSGLGGTEILIKNVEITGNDSALITCSWGLNRKEPDTMREVSFNVQFGRANSQLYFKSITKLNIQKVQG